MKDNLDTLRDEELVRMAREGSGAAEEHLIERYRSLAKEKSKMYYITGADAEDVIQEGMIGIFKAVRDYNTEGSASFRTFADLCVTRQILTAVQGANRRKHQILNNAVSLNHKAYFGKRGGQESDEGHSMLEQIPDRAPEDPAAEALFSAIFDDLENEGSELFSSLESQVWDCLRQGMSYREIAEKLDRSAKSIDNAIQRIRRKISDYLK